MLSSFKLVLLHTSTGIFSTTFQTVDLILAHISNWYTSTHSSNSSSSHSSSVNMTEFRSQKLCWILWIFYWREKRRTCVDVWNLYYHIVTILVNLRHAEELGDFLQDYNAVNRGNLWNVTNLGWIYGIPYLHRFLFPPPLFRLEKFELNL